MSKENETTLLDSSLNTVVLSLEQLNKIYYKNYNIKVIDMQDYKQIYIFPNVKVYREKIDNDKKLLFNDNLFNYDKKTRSSFSDNKPLFKNVIRSKIKLQRLVKCNSNEFKTFITLTFKEDIKDSMQVRLNEQPDAETMIYIIKLGNYKTLVEVKPNSIRQLLDL